MFSLAQIYLALIVPASVIAFVMMGYDKRQAKFGGRRVAEKTLHTVELVGGWPGSWIGQRYFHHKTHKTSYQFMFWIVAVLHATFWMWAV
jgi:uncharacterized membrane protein YsdA (DUF1294 family)